MAHTIEMTTQKKVNEANQPSALIGSPFSEPKVAFAEAAPVSDPTAPLASNGVPDSPMSTEAEPTSFITIEPETFNRLLWVSSIFNLVGAVCYYVAVVLVHFDPLLGLQFVIPARSGNAVFAVAFSCDVVWVASVSSGRVGALDLAGTALSALSFAGLTATAVSDSYALLLVAAWALFLGLSMKLFAHFHGIYTKGWAAALRQHEPAQVQREAVCMTWALGVGGTLGALVLGYSTLIPVEQVPWWYSVGAGGIATAVAVGITNVVLRLREEAAAAAAAADAAAAGTSCLKRVHLEGATPPPA